MQEKLANELLDAANLRGGREEAGRRTQNAEANKRSPIIVVERIKIWN